MKLIVFKYDGYHYKIDKSVFDEICQLYNVLEIPADYDSYYDKAYFAYIYSLVVDDDKLNKLAELIYEKFRIYISDDAFQEYKFTSGNTVIYRRLPEILLKSFVKDLAGSEITDVYVDDKLFFSRKDFFFNED